MDIKTPYVKVSAGFYLKDKPEGYLGLTQETWNFGNEPTSFAGLVWGFIRCLLDFHLLTTRTPTDELNAQIKELGQAILGLKVEDEEVL